MFAYALRDPRAFRALARAIGDDGLLPEVCVGTGATDSRDFYLKRKRVKGDPHGQAPVLWLCNTLLKTSTPQAVRSRGGNRVTSFRAK